MTDSKHTPGPWGYEDPMGPEILTIVANPKAEVYNWVWVAQIGTSKEDGDKRSLKEHIANARLIAAAPELLDGCNALLGLIQLVCARDDMPAAIREALTTSHRVEEARAAIAKVEEIHP
jgi:hypothetical protein